MSRIPAPTKAELREKKREQLKKDTLRINLDNDALRIGLLAIDRERWARKVKKWIEGEKAKGRIVSINQYPEWDAFRVIEDIYHNAVKSLSIDGDEGRGA